MFVFSDVSLFGVGILCLFYSIVVNLIVIQLIRTKTKEHQLTLMAHIHFSLVISVTVQLSITVLLKARIKYNVFFCGSRLRLSKV